MQSSEYSVWINGSDTHIRRRHLAQAKAEAREEVLDLGYDDPAAYPWGVDLEIKRGRVTYRSEDLGKTWRRSELVRIA